LLLRIGFAIAQRLAEEGAKVVISSRKEANVKKALGQFKEMGLTSVLGTVCHVGNASDRENLLKKVRLYCFFNSFMW
jgi:dehydrogenase/reductase SDR family protein 4